MEQRFQNTSKQLTPLDLPIYRSQARKSPPQDSSVSQHHQKKDKYSKRMQQLAPQIKTLSKTYRLPSPETNSPRARNNQASKESRKRRKIYIQLLEQNIINIQRELSAAQNEIEELRSGIFNALMHTDENSQNAQIQQLVIRKLSGLVQQPASGKVHSEINICLDSCIYRIGASGSQRRAILDILYAGMINRNLPNIYRYILWSAVQRTQLFRTQESLHENWWTEVQPIGEQIIQAHKQFLQERAPIISDKGKEVLVCSRRILGQKKQIEQLGLHYDQMLKIFRKIMTPSQFASLFLFVERAIHREELRLFQDQVEDRNPDYEKFEQIIPAKKIKRDKT